MRDEFRAGPGEQRAGGGEHILAAVVIDEIRVVLGSRVKGTECHKLPRSPGVSTIICEILETFHWTVGGEHSKIMVAALRAWGFEEKGGVFGQAKVRIFVGNCGEFG